jgi:hypothetical protein
VGDALLFQRRAVVGLVLRLPLCSSHLRSATLSSSLSELSLNESPDLRGVDKLSFNFDIGRPFRPFEQLMGVMPAASQGLLPPAYRVST